MQYFAESTADTEVLMHYIYISYCILAVRWPLKSYTNDFASAASVLLAIHNFGLKV